MPTCLSDDLSALDPTPIPFAIKALNVVAVGSPFVGFIAAVIYLWGRGIDRVQFTVFCAMVFSTSLGVTIGFHRLFTHKSFETIWPIKLMFGILGSMALEGPVIKWSVTHRHHHQHSDLEADPHSPNHHGGGAMGVLKGLWHAHIGWLFAPEIPNLAKYAPDLAEDPVTSFVSRHFTLWVLAGLFIPAAICGLTAWSWSGALLGLLWGGFARLFIVHHMTWSINSVCHIWGTRPFRSHDHSRNNFIFGVISWGEGWHNNHHAFPTSARHGLQWWQIDISWWVIALMSKLGLVWKVRLPSPSAIQRQRKAEPSTPSVSANLSTVS